MNQELAYSFHLGSDKNKSKLSKKVAKENVSGSTSLANNAIQNVNDLSRVNKHNLRDYDNQRELIRVIYGTDNILTDVQDLYLQEFEEAKLEYNKQTRNDRKITNYFEKICESQNDVACEIIIELGDMDFWNDKDDKYRFKMIDVYNEQVKDLINIVPTFKIANATIHFDETSPHMHVVGVPVIENCKRGMDFKLKDKQKGRNQDINVKDMSDYRQIKKQLENKEKKLAEANKQTKKLDNTTKYINSILDNLKPSKLNKNNMLISIENVQIIKNYTEDVKNTTKVVRNVNDLNMAIKDFEHSSFEIKQENNSLKYQLEQKNDEIDNLKGELSAKDKVIDKLRNEKEKIKQELHKFKDFWYSIMGHFHKRICYNKDENYKTEMYEKFNIMLKEIDEEYRATLINFAKYKIVMFTMAKIMEMEQSVRNKVALYLFNNIQ